MHLNSLLPHIHSLINASLTAQSSDNCKQAHLEMVEQQLKRKIKRQQSYCNSATKIQNPIRALRRLLKVGRSSVVLPRLFLHHGVCLWSASLQEPLVKLFQTLY